MTNGFEEAKLHRNWLERLVDKIPGFRGYQNRELRRDVDRLQREHLAKELGGLKTVVRMKAREYTDEGQIGMLHLFERLDRGLDGLSQAVRFADYGASGLFDVIKIGDEELEKLYAFDLSLLDDLEFLFGELEAVPAPGTEDPRPSLDRALDGVAELRGKWSERDNVVASVVERSS
jgi:hypothetical protein